MSKHTTFVVRCRGIILHENKLLVVQHVHNQTIYALPGGHLEPGEDVKECIIRELKEELSINPDVGRLLYVNTFKDGGDQPIELFFEITNGADYLDIKKDGATHAFELSDVKWIDVNEDVNLLPEQLAKDFQSGKLLSDQTRFIKSW